MQSMYFKNPLKYKRAWAQDTLVVFLRFFFFQAKGYYIVKQK